MPTLPISDWRTAVITAVASALAQFMAALPRIAAFLAILIIGWIVAWFVAGIVAAFLRALRFNDLARRSGLSGFLVRTGVRKDAAGVIAEIAKWFLRLFVLVAAFEALGLPAVSRALEPVFLWLPNLAVALVVLVVAGLLANGLYRLVYSAAEESGLENPRLLANLARIAVWGSGIVVAVNQIGIAATLVNTLFMAVLGALALAFGLAFGLGGRETAATIIRDWYASWKKASERTRSEVGGREGEDGGRRAA